MDVPEKRKSSDSEADLNKILSKLNDLPADQRGERALRMAARLVEYGAFELAGRVSSETVGEMVNLSARLSGRRNAADAAPSGADVVQLFPGDR